MDDLDDKQTYDYSEFSENQVIDFPVAVYLMNDNLMKAVHDLADAATRVAIYQGLEKERYRRYLASRTFGLIRGGRAGDKAF
jgi:hypothetical protein